MKRIMLAILATFVITQAPWRILMLAANVVLTPASQTRVSDRDDDYWRARTLETRLNELGWIVQYQSNLSYRGQTAYGITDPSEHTIFIDESLHWNTRFDVLAHEAGHAFQPGWMNRAQGEVFAECVSTLFTQRRIQDHARYLARYKPDFLLITALEWSAMYHATAALRD